jgi:hypothetical protein
MKKVILTAFILLTFQGAAMAQDAMSRTIVDTPTAGLIPKGNYAFGVRLSPSGTTLGELVLGVFDRFELGVSYGGRNIVGSGDVDWYPRVEFQAKYRVIDESLGFPAIALGYNSQGQDGYSSTLDRYTVKSRGFYGVLSKNYRFLGEMGLHAGVGMSMEGTGEDENEPDLFLGITKSINPDFLIMLEYDLPISSDSIAESLDEGEGYFNVGVRVKFVEHLFLELDLRNINENARYNNRTVQIVYESPLF